MSAGRADGPTGDGPTGDGPTGDGPTGDGPTGDVEVEGVVEAQLPSALYRVRLADGGPGSRPGARPGAAHGTVTAHLSADPRRNFVRILVGERVRVRLSPRDLTRGAIVARLGERT